MSSDRDRIRQLEGLAVQFENTLQNLTQEAGRYLTKVNGLLAEKADINDFHACQSDVDSLKHQLKELKTQELRKTFALILNEQLGQECDRLAENEKLAAECRLLKEDTKKAVASMQERIALMQEENQKLRAELEQHTTLSWWQHLVYGLIGSHK